MRNPFKAPSAEEIARDKKEREELKVRIKSLSELGQKVIAHPDFIKYREELIKQKDEIIKAMIESVNPDPVQDAYFLRCCLNKLSAYYELLELPKDDASRKV